MTEKARKERWACEREWTNLESGCFRITHRPRSGLTEKAIAHPRAQPKRKLSPAESPPMVNYNSTRRRGGREAEGGGLLIGSNYSDTFVFSALRTVKCAVLRVF